MKVRAIINRGSSLPESLLGDRTSIYPGTKWSITPGDIYIVYAETDYQGHPWYYVIEDDEPRWPFWIPAPLFELVALEVPPTWERKRHVGQDGEEFGIFSFPEWARDNHFYERLVDGDPSAVDTFAWRRLEVETL